MGHKATCSLDNAQTTLKRPLHEAFCWGIIELFHTSAHRVYEISWIAQQVCRANKLEHIRTDCGRVVLVELLLDYSLGAVDVLDL